MAGQKISQLSGLETLTGAEKIPVELNGGNYSIPTSLLKPFVFTWKPNRDQSFDQLIKCLTTGIPVIYKVSDQEAYPVIGYAKIGAQDTIALWSRNSADALNVVVAKDTATGGVSVVSMDYVDIVKYVNASDDEHPNRKAIQLRNNDPLTGMANKEGLGSVNIAMVNDKDIVDLGTSELPINLNTPDGVRPTVQEASQTGETANKIAYLSDLEGISGGVEVIKITAIDPSWRLNYYIDVEENNKVISCMENGIPFIFQMWVGFGGNPYAYISKYFFPIGWDVLNDKYIIYYNDLGLYEMGDDRKSSIKLNLNLTFEKNKTERYQIGSSTNALIDLRYRGDGAGGYKFLADDGTYKSVDLSSAIRRIDLLLFNTTNLRINHVDAVLAYKYINQNIPFVFYISNEGIVLLPITINRMGNKYIVSCFYISGSEGNFLIKSVDLDIFEATVNYYAGTISEGLTFLKDGNGTKFLSDNGNYVSVLPTGGTEGQILKIVDGNPKWVDPS